MFTSMLCLNTVKVDGHGLPEVITVLTCIIPVNHFQCETCCLYIETFFFFTGGVQRTDGDGDVFLFFLKTYECGCIVLNG